MKGGKDFYRIEKDISHPQRSIEKQEMVAFQERRYLLLTCLSVHPLWWRHPCSTTHPQLHQFISLCLVSNNNQDFVCKCLVVRKNESAMYIPFYLLKNNIKLFLKLEFCVDYII